MTETTAADPRPAEPGVPRRDLPGPRTWVERSYPNLTYFNEVDKGGHFAAWEEPELFSQEMRAAFQSLR
jgi:pimeloyl-ACP methyl ester carboxylesterase